MNTRTLLIILIIVLLLAWAACALLVAVVLRLPLLAVLAGAALAGLPEPGRRCVLGAHWLGRRSASRCSRLWCGRLARRRARATPAAGLMDLGLDGQGRARHRRLEGDRLRRSRPGSPRRARAWRSPRAIPSACARRPTGSAAHGVVFDSADLDAVPRRDRRRRGGARPDRHLRRQHRRPARRRGPARLLARAVGGGAPHARALADGVPRAAAARACASAAGAASSRSRSSAVREPIAGAPALQRPPARA